MKINRIFIAGLLFCLSGAAAGAMGYSGGGTERKVYDVGNFNSVSNSTSADLEIRLGERLYVEAEGDSSSLRFLKISVRNGELLIRRNPSAMSLSAVKDVKITISFPGYDLESLVLSSSGNAVISGELKSENTRLTTSSSGSIRASGDVEYLELNTSSSGDIDFTGNSREIAVRITSSGDVTADTQSMVLDAELSSSGNLTARGAALETTLRISSSGDFRGNRFQTDSADISINSSSGAELTVMGTLKARLSGSGNLVYGGSPKIDELKTSGSGRLKQGL